MLRARYYDPTTGEFTSPDPLEYVDGMSLFRGYFLVKGVDPIGTHLFVDDDKKKLSCKEFLDSFTPIEGLEGPIENVINRRNPFVYCGNCSDLFGGIPGISVTFVVKNTKRCYICLNEKNEGYKEEWRALLVHELTHCKHFKCSKPNLPIEIGTEIPPDVELPNDPPPGCSTCLKYEREAYTNQCTMLFSPDLEKIDKCRRAGVCKSCVFACKGNKKFERDCANAPKAPRYVPPGHAPN